ncbi:alpha/beta fold hydrolase [Streptomyces sparsogenes]|uniref:Alpha/beta hydrolase fold protein n=1 Tax=Streptomyces sparsogenes DSM 40356 TaxID=1331668 RepID=A0A1R1SCR5_9ACTN|nr:alpha/beta hydrolase [Streptomyces sparsogenes]OMI36075.1 alpha/beta hydrolase fold protein [Streptomyces sparsogenes DSM 40356]
MTQLKYVNANDLEFAYLEAGPADAPLALCLHGFPDTAHTWRHLLPALGDAGYHAVAPFLRGYAPTGIPADGAYQAGAIASDANALHDALGGDGDAVLIGHDWGAIAAYGATAHAPERWRRAVTMAVPPLGGVLADFFDYDYDQFKRSFYIFLFQTPLAEAGVAAHDMALIDGLWRDWSPGYHHAEQDIAHVKESLREPANLEAAIGYYRALFDPSRHVEKYAAEQEAITRTGERPTLYLHGTADGCIGADVVGSAKDNLPPGSRVELVEGAGHFLHLERPEAINREILTWLGAVS